MKRIGIYRIINPKGKVYIGQSIDVDSREKDYARCKCKSQTKLYNSIKKYGWDAHVFDYIFSCSREHLNNAEVFWISQYNSYGSDDGLNLRSGGKVDKMSDETRLKMSAARLGGKNPMHGKTHSAEARAKISAAQKGRKRTPEQKANIGRHSRGRVKSAEEIEKIRQSKIGKPRSEDTKSKISEARKKAFKVTGKFRSIIFDSVTAAADFLGCSRKEISLAMKRDCKYKGFNLMYV